MKGRDKYLKESVTAVLIALVAALAACLNQNSYEKDFGQPDQPVIEVRARPQSLQAFDIFFAPEMREQPEPVAPARRDCFAANTERFLRKIACGR